MSPAEMNQRAAETVRRARLSGELGIAVHEGFSSSRADGVVSEMLGDVIPGVSALVSRAAGRIVLVTDQQVHIFEGRRFDRPKTRIASYPRGADVMRFDGEKLTFPGGHAVYLSAHQARELAFAAGDDPNVTVADGVRGRAGVTGERGLLAIVGHDPRTFKKRLSDRFADLTEGDFGDMIGLSEGETSAEGRIVLVTDRNVYVIKGDGLVASAPGSAPLAVSPTGPSAFSQRDATLTFPNGAIVSLGSVAAAREVAEAAGVPVAPAHNDGGTWVAEAGLGGIYRLVRDGHRTTATWLVDRGLGLPEQVAALEAITWAPPPYVAPIIKATRENALTKVDAPDLPDGRVTQPFLGAYLAAFVRPEAADHPVRRYLWPSVDLSGNLALEPGEAIVREWAADITLYRARSADAAGPGLPAWDISQLVETRIVLTNTRLVAAAQRTAEQRADGDERNHWVSHFRYEWIHEVGTLSTTKFKQAGLRRREELGTTHAFYAQLRLRNGLIMEIVMPPDTVGTVPLVTQVADMIAATDPGRSVAPAPPTSHQPGLARWVRTRLAVAGAVPYSLPERLP